MLPSRLCYPKENASEALNLASSHMAWRSSHTFHPRGKNNVFGFCHEKTSTSAGAPFRNTSQVDVPNVLKDNKIVTTKNSKHIRDKIVKTVLAPHLTKELQLCQGHVLPGFY